MSDMSSKQEVTVKQLRAEAKATQIKGYSKMKKDDLISSLINSEENYIGDEKDLHPYRPTGFEKVSI